MYMVRLDTRLGGCVHVEDDCPRRIIFRTASWFIVMQGVETLWYRKDLDVFKTAKQLAGSAWVHTCRPILREVGRLRWQDDTGRDKTRISRYRSLCDEMQAIHILHSMQKYDFYVPGRNVRLIGFLKSLFHHSVHGYSDACSSTHSRWLINYETFLPGRCDHSSRSHRYDDMSTEQCRRPLSDLC